MEKIAFNNNWKCYKTDDRERAVMVTLPHDAMFLDDRKEGCPGGENNGWIDAGDYTYEKAFLVPAEHNNKLIVFELEGAYHKASVYLNGRKAAFHDYGYSGFYVKANEYLRFGEINEIRVEVINSDQPNCRWYAGTGLYRPVWMYVLPMKHISLEGIRITTLDYQNPRVLIQVEVVGAGKIAIEIIEKETGNIIDTQNGQVENKFSCERTIPNAKLWSAEHPALYTCRVIYGEDVREEDFGIRMVECTPRQGFEINGKRVILRGACIHHDNGILGASAHDFAEERKIRILKEQGYNAIRSAHNPCSKALLRACDKLGMLVVDEYVDVWYIHKTKYDYAAEVVSHYKQDLSDLVNKDYNHPSVVMYSTGNEVSETAQKKGIDLCGNMTAYLHKLDGTRPVTCGINIFFNFLSSVGFGVYSDKNADRAVEDASKKKAVGSEFFNNLAGIFGAKFMKFGAALYPCDLKTRDAYEKMDVAGYNYGINRYKKDLKKYPDRMILGSETFCSDARRFYQMAKKNPRIIGDFVWAGMDYLGEVGVGSWEYKTYAPDFSHGKGWVSAGSGRIDLTGKPLAEMRYTRAAYELDKIGIGVIPVKYAREKHSPSAWKMSNALESWSFAGCAGMKTTVEVYAVADHVSLYVNEKRIGTKSPRKDCIVRFPVTYQDGSVKAVAYNSENQVLAEKIIYTAGKETGLKLEAEQVRINVETDLCYVRLKYTDEAGEVKPLIRGKIQVSVQGGEILGTGNGCPYYSNSYLTDTTDTYYGEALAIIRPLQKGKMVVTATSQYGNGRVEIEVV